MNSSRPVWMTYYNGWSWEERMAVVPIQQAALRSGKIARPNQCDLCKRVPFNASEARSKIILHTEMYDRPLEFIPLCQFCHASLHARFSDPQRWVRLLTKLKGGPEWARILSMNPSSQTIPFQDIYSKIDQDKLRSAGQVSSRQYYNLSFFT